jgi:hypothetical protein
MYGGFHFKYE